MTKKSKAAVAAIKEPVVVRDIPMDLIDVRGGTQMRTCLDDDTVRDYTERMTAGDEFPPIVVFQEGSKFWLADGFHRYRARRNTDATTICAEVHQGNLSDAIECAVGANKTNGLPRKNEDKQMAVRAALAHERLRRLSDRQIADLAGVGHAMVSRMRSGEVELSQRDSCSALSDTTERRLGADGKMRRLPRNRKSATEPAADIMARVDRTVLPPLPDGTFGIIYAEPAWRPREGLIEVSVDAPTWSAADLCELEVKKLAEDNSALCLWAPCSHLADALKVMKAWGFTYQTALIFDRKKTTLGRAHRFHIPTGELLLIGTRGACLPDHDERPVQVESYYPRRPSSKTTYFRDIVQGMFPARRRLLLLGTIPPSMGWDAWGIEATQNAA